MHPSSAALAPPPHAAAVNICEVGPRDGLQSVAATMPTAVKLAWLDALYAAGLRQIEVTSFVPARLMPQLADAAEVVRHARTLPGLRVLALAPNLKGVQAAAAAGAHAVTVPLSASQAHSQANLRKTIEQAVQEVRDIVTWRHEAAPDLHIEAGISVAFGCSMQGPVPQDDVIRLAHTLAQAGVDGVGVSDTTGYANPAQVRSMYTRLFAEIGNADDPQRPGLCGGAHVHNTRGLGLANCLAAYDVGVRTFDASLAGLGGCPHAPGASGNVVTEDLVFMFEAMGIRTGVDVARLVAARAPLEQGLPGEPLYGMTPLAGVPKGYRPASEALA
jgi:hydroxymethylglutaryl-CoA lyase